MSHPSGVGRFTDRISKEAVALGAAVVLVGGLMLIGQQSVTSEGSSTPTPSASTTVRDPRANTVVAVNSAAPASAEAAWNATALRTLPGSLIVVPPASATECSDVEVDAAVAGPAIKTTAECSASDPYRTGNAHASLRQAVDVTQGRLGSLVLLGEGWTEQSPVPLDPALLNDPMAVAIALQYAETAGTLPDMEGVDVVIAGPPPSPEMRRIWDAYLEAAGAASVEWATSWAAASAEPDK